MTLKLLLTACLAAVAIAGCAAKEGYAVDELADKANADKEAFMGKEVVVHGYVFDISPDKDKDGYTLHLDFDPQSSIQRKVHCSVSHGQAHEGIRTKWVTVKGEITNIHHQNYTDLKRIQLDQCEIVRSD